MAFLDFMKGKRAAKQQEPAKASPEQKPATPTQGLKAMYAQQEAQDKQTQRPITPEIKAEAERAVAILDKSTIHLQKPVENAAPDGGTNAAHRQKQNHQDKAQEGLSPTDGATGKTAVQDKGNTPQKTTERSPQTVARRPPSWER